MGAQLPWPKTLEDFARRFLTGRISWRAVPRQHAITNFGNIISFVLFRDPPFQVELFIIPHDRSSFTSHRHPHVDVVEFGLSGQSMLYIDGQPACSEETVVRWMTGDESTMPVLVGHEAWHYGHGCTPYAFLSIQQWLDGVRPTSVGLDWEGSPSSPEQELLLGQRGTSG